MSLLQVQLFAKIAHRTQESTSYYQFIIKDTVRNGQMGGMWKRVQSFHALSRRTTLPASSPTSELYPFFEGFYGGSIM